MTNQLFVHLRGYGGTAAPKREFFKLLGIGKSSPLPCQAGKSPHHASHVELLAVSLADAADDPEPAEKMAQDTAEGLRLATEILRGFPPDAFDQWRSRGRKCDVYIGAWIDNDQFDLVLPAEFLHACATAGLAIHLCTND